MPFGSCSFPLFCVRVICILVREMFFECSNLGGITEEKAEMKEKQNVRQPKRNKKIKLNLMYWKTFFTLGVS